MEVKTNVFLSEEDVRAIIKKHLEKQGYKVIGELDVNIKRMKNGETIEISAEVQKLFKNRIDLPKQQK
jgi:uncharacterized protein (DUF302 family)